MERWRLLSILGSFLIWLTGCASAPVSLDPALTDRLPPAHEITDTPFFPQDAYQCGPAALATVLNYHGHHRTPQQLTPWVFTPDAKGSFPAELDAVTRREGFISYPVNQFEALLTEVTAGHPVLVLQNLGTGWLTQWHFAVVIGFDRDRRELVLRSGDQSRRVTPFTLFDTTWKRGGRWSRVILPPTQLPASAEPLPYLKAAADLEQTGPKAAAIQAFRTSAQRWPDQPLAYFGLGNGLYEQGDYKGAHQAFETLLQLQPDLAAGWNNYAHVLKALECPSQAQQAITCGLAWEPEHPALQSSLMELMQPASSDNPACPRALTCTAP